MFQVAVKTKRQEQREGRDRPPMPPTQIERALRELHVVWIPAHSPQAKGRVERQFSTAQDRLVKGMRVAGVRTIEEANAYLETEYLPWWNQTLTVQPADAADAHRPLGKDHDLAAILSHVEQRQVTNDYTVRYDGKVYQIDRRDIRVGMRKARVRVEERLDGSSRAVPEALCARAPLRSAIARTGSAQTTRLNRHAQPASPKQKRLDEELLCPLGPFSAPGYRGDPMLAVERRRRDQRQMERRAKPARRSSRFMYPKTAARGLHQSRSVHKNQNPQNGQLRARFDWGLGAVCFGASPVAAVFGSAPGSATPPEHRIHSNPTPPAAPSKQDISTLLGIGHFYFALT